MALLCSLFEYDVTIHPSAFLVVTLLFLSPIILLAFKIITSTRNLSPGAGAKVVGLVTLDICVGLSVLLAIGVVLVQQRRDKEIIVTEEIRENNMVRRDMCYVETNV